MKYVAAVALAISLAVLTGCGGGRGTSGPAVPSLGPMRSGDSFVYDGVLYTISGPQTFAGTMIVGQGQTASDGTISCSVSYTCIPPNTTLIYTWSQDRDRAIYSDSFPDDGSADPITDECGGRYKRAPGVLRVGESWSYDVYTNGGEHVTGTSEIAGVETITVPLGTFEAYRVETYEMDSRGQTHRLEWYSPQFCVPVLIQQANPNGTVMELDLVTVNT